MTRDKATASSPSRAILAIAIASMATPTFGHIVVASTAGVLQEPRTVAFSDTIPPRPKAVPLDSVRVIAVWNASATPSGQTSVGADAASGQAPVRAHLDESIILVVRDLRRLDARARCVDLDEQPVPGCVKQHLALFLDGREVRGLAPQSPPPRPGKRLGVVRFRLERTTESDSTWSEVLGNPPLERRRPWYRSTEVSVGVSGGFPVPTDVTGGRFELTRVVPGRPYVATVMIVWILILLLCYARSSDLFWWSGAEPLEPGRWNTAPK